MLARAGSTAPAEDGQLARLSRAAHLDTARLGG